jgi:TonB family protein
MADASLPHVEHHNNKSRLRLLSSGVVTVAIFAVAWMTLLAAPAFHPAKYQSGTIPPLPPPTVVGGGEVWLELDVTSTGAVRGTKLLRTTPPYGDVLAAAAKSWRFTPAEEEKVPAPASPTEPKFRSIDSTVLLVSIVRGPTYYSGATLGDSPRNLAAAVDGTPVPQSTPPASYPPLARQAGQVLIETTIGINGRPSGSRVLQSTPPFDEFALEALRGWSFRAARVSGLTSPVFAYVAFGFREPVAAGGLPLPPSNFPQTPPRR